MGKFFLQLLLTNSTTDQKESGFLEKRGPNRKPELHPTAPAQEREALQNKTKIKA